jgi:hypothetical protein
VLTPFDDYPLHQTSEPIAHTAQSSLNHYDRYFFNGYSRDGSLYFGAALGLYPNRKVMDAAFAVLHGGEEISVIASRRAPLDPTETRVGPISVTIEEPFRRMRVRVGPNESGIEADLVFGARSAVVEEPRFTLFDEATAVFDYTRLTQWGAWSGTLSFDGSAHPIAPADVLGCRDRSWGIRPVGEAEPAGRPNEFTGMWWCWIPLRFDDFAMHLILEEDREVVRNTNFAVRVFPEGSGRGIEQLGWPLPEIRYAPGTRNPIGASIELTNRDGKKSTLEIEPLIGIPLNVGCGYGADPDWTHGLWKGEGWVEGSQYDYGDPAVTGRAAFSLWDHVARVTFEGHEGWGIFEHGCIGAHAPSGFADLTSVAP